MPRKYFFLFIFFITVLLFSCRRKHTPEKVIPETSVNIPNKKDSLAIKKPVFKPKAKDIIPKFIVVNDSAAKRSVDGRLYYDLLGHRYWKNYKNGKYYLFNQKMYDNPAFKAPK